MRIAVSADWHLEAGLGHGVIGADGVSSRFRDHERLIDAMAAEIVAHKADVFIFCGDLARTRTPSPAAYRVVQRFVDRIATAGIPSIWVMGNHDFPLSQGRPSALKPIDDPFRMATVVEAPQLVRLGSLRVVCFPALPPWKRSDPVPYIEQLAGYPGNDILVLAAHLAVKGAMLPTGLPVDAVMEPVDLDRVLPRFDAVFLGDIHRRQVLSESPLMFYPGSPYRVDFAEAADPKGFALVEF